MTTAITTQNQFKLAQRNPNRMRFRPIWGGKFPGIQIGDVLQGILLGFEESDMGKQNLVLKSFTHGGEEVLVYTCSAIEYEMHDYKEVVVSGKVKKVPDLTKPLFPVGSVLQITYKGFYVGKEGVAKDKHICKFDVDEIVNYELSERDIDDITAYQNRQLLAKPLAAYQQQAAPLAAPVAAQVVPQQKFAPTGRPQFQKSNANDSFDIPVKS